MGISPDSIVGGTEFTLEGRQAALNIQPEGSKAKAYQVKQVRQIIIEQKLTSDGEDK